MPRQRWMRRQLEKFAARAHRAIRTDAAVVFREKSEGPPCVRAGAQKTAGRAEGRRSRGLRIQTEGNRRQHRALRHRVLVRHLHPFTGARDGAEAGMRRAPGGNHAHRGGRIFAGTSDHARRTRRSQAGRKIRGLPDPARKPAAQFPAGECFAGDRKARASRLKVQHLRLHSFKPGRVEPPPGATTQLDGGEPKPPRLRVFSQQDKLIAIAEAVVPRTYQPIVVFEALP